MTTAQAIAHAASDLEHIRAIVATCAPEELVVDGSMFSPSWRALSGGTAVWDVFGHLDGESYDAFDAYVDALDAGTDELGLMWEDGCLWMPGWHDED